MGIDSGNGDTREPLDDSNTWLRNDESLDEAIARLVIVMLREAVRRHCTEIQIEIGEESCPIHFVGSDTKIEMDSLPAMLIPRLKDHLAKVCGNRDCQAQGSFSAALKRAETSAKSYGKVTVMVAFGESDLRLTIKAFEETP